MDDCDGDVDSEDGDDDDDDDDDSIELTECCSDAERGPSCSL